MPNMTMHIKKSRHLLLSAASVLALQGAADARAELPQLLEDYCVKCHNFEDWAGSLDIESLNLDHVESAPDEWEKIIRKVRTGMMPPQGEPRPDRAAMDGLAVLVENTLDSTIEPVPAAPALHRLNRTEYANVIRDLLHLEIEAPLLLPQDDSSEGFDNIAATLTNSPALMQGYTSAAMKISRWAVGDMTAMETTASFSTPADFAQDGHIDGLPLGTRGGMKVSYNFPLDAEYEFSVRGGRGFGGSGRIALDITLDGEVIEVENPRSFRLPVSAGTHVLTAAVIDLERPAGVNDIYSEYSVSGGVDNIEITGPFNPTGPGVTTSRERVFSCYPANNDEAPACAEEIVTKVATRAFRRPVNNEDIAPAMAFYQRGYAEAGFEAGVQQALSRILIDPNFLFKLEKEPEDVAPGEAYRLSDLELATRLSFFLWSSIPDDELLDLAIAGKLSDPGVLEAQVRRMIDDPKARALVENFAGQWLFLRQVAGVTPEAEGFDENLRKAFIRETELLVENVIAEDRPVAELLNADYTFLNERLADHYGIDGVRGSHFRKVTLDEASPRRGLLGHGSILTITSTASRTSPVIRGSWILENLLHAPVPAPPPGVETNLDGDGNQVLTSSVRERLEAHRADPACGSCHSVIDPVGFALENFDMIGGWREFDGDSPVDATGTLVDGSTVTGPADLREALLDRSIVFVSTMTEKLLTYALGRGLEYYDMPTVRSIMKQAEANEYRFSDLVLGVAGSEQFQMRVKGGGEAVAAATH